MKRFNQNVNTGSKLSSNKMLGSSVPLCNKNQLFAFVVKEDQFA